MSAVTSGIVVYFSSVAGNIAVRYSINEGYHGFLECHGMGCDKTFQQDVSYLGFELYERKGL